MDEIPIVMIDLSKMNLGLRLGDQHVSRSERSKTTESVFLWQNGGRALSGLGSEEQVEKSGKEFER